MRDRNTNEVRGTNIGRYRLIASLGSGGMADVFLAVVLGPMGWSKLSVVKRLRPAMVEDAGLVEMFFDEARLAARLTHPNVVHTYEVGEEAGQYFIAMEFLEGQSLNKVAKLATKDPFFTPAVWAWVVAEALGGLHYAHEAADFDGTPLRIVHRDVSPHNIFVTYGGQVKIVDFGIAKAALNATHTQEGVLKGKLSYMAPEQARTSKVDRRADIFSMGIVLWELLTGHKLLAGDQVNVLHRLLNDQPLTSITQLKPDLDPALVSIVHRALEKDRERRFASAAEMQNALLDYLRSSKAQVDNVAVGRALSNLFREVREKVQRDIQIHMADAASGSLPALPAVPASAASVAEGVSAVSQPLSRSQGWSAAMAPPSSSRSPSSRPGASPSSRPPSSPSFSSLASMNALPPVPPPPAVPRPSLPPVLPAAGAPHPGRANAGPVLAAAPAASVRGGPLSSPTSAPPLVATLPGADVAPPPTRAQLLALRWSQVVPFTPKQTAIIAAAAASGALAAAILGIAFRPERRAAGDGPRGGSLAGATATAAPRVSLVEIASEPAGAAVQWNGTPVGRTPFVRECPLGVQAFTLSLEGYVPQTVVVNLAESGTVEKRGVTLQRRDATP